MRGPMKLSNSGTGLMQCQICGSKHVAHIRAGGHFYRGSWQCSEEHCPSNHKVWSATLQRFVKEDWHKILLKQEAENFEV